MTQRNSTQSPQSGDAIPPAPVMPLPGRRVRASSRRHRAVAFDAVLRAGSAFGAEHAATVAAAVGVGRILVGDSHAVDEMPEMVSA